MFHARSLSLRRIGPPDVPRLTLTDNHTVVGFKVGPRTWLGEGETFLAAYHELHKQVVG